MTTARSTPLAAKDGSRNSTGERHADDTHGFGVPKTVDPHHYVVHIPRGSKRPVLIHEELGTESDSLEHSVIDRVQLERHRWTAIADAVKRVFNARLIERKLTTSRWKVGDNVLDRLFGKELCVLAWAIEDVEPDNIPVALRNWLGLRPEERWWLFSMTAAVTGGVNDRGRGWRMALRYALADTPQGEPARPRLIARPRNGAKASVIPGLFDSDEGQ